MPRVNKTKAEIAAKMKQDAKVAKMVSLVKLFWPYLDTLDSIYEAQTALNAAGGYIELGIKIKEDELTVKDLNIDLSKEEESKIKTALTSILGLLEIENARDMVTLTRKAADMLGQYGANEFLKGPMTSIKVTDIVK